MNIKRKHTLAKFNACDKIVNVQNKEHTSFT